SNYWVALDQVGDVAQRFAQRYKHQREKQALGLPRRIGPPPSGKFHPGKQVRDRHASPLWYHLARDAQGLVLRIAALPAAALPDLASSAALLGQLLDHFRAEMPQRVALHAQLGKRAPGNPAAPAAPLAAPPVAVPGAPGKAALPRASDTVEAELLAEK